MVEKEQLQFPFCFTPQQEWINRLRKNVNTVSVEGIQICAGPTANFFILTGGVSCTQACLCLQSGHQCFHFSFMNCFLFQALKVTSAGLTLSFFVSCFSLSPNGMFRPIRSITERTSIGSQSLTKIEIGNHIFQQPKFNLCFSLALKKKAFGFKQKKNRG